jgi:hypothetical protein
LARSRRCSSRLLDATAAASSEVSGTVASPLAMENSQPSCSVKHRVWSNIRNRCAHPPIRSAKCFISLPCQTKFSPKAIERSPMRLQL